DEAAANGRYHLIVAADVFMYMGDLAAVVSAIAPCLETGGALAFTVETHDGDGVILRDTLRYAHDAAHVKSALKAAGLKLLSLEFASTRTKKGDPFPGLVVIIDR